MAEIKMSLEEYQEFIRQRDTALADAETAKQKLVEAQLHDPDGMVQQLLDAVNAALPVVKFATGNLDPRTVRGWPYASLEAISKALDVMPTTDPAYKELAAEFRSFVHEGQALEAERYSTDAAAFGGNATLTVVFKDEQTRDAFMDHNGLSLPESLSEMRRRYYVCAAE